MSTHIINFFSRTVPYDNGMKLFGGLHIGITAFFLILYAAVIVFRDKLSRFRNSSAARRNSAWVLFLNMLVHYTGRTAIGEWRFSEDLPLHICFVTNFFMIYILYTDNRRGLFRVIYYFTLIGPLPAIIFPDVSRTWSGYLFYQFIISHHVMLLFSLYCAFVLRYDADLKGAVTAFIYGNAYVGFAAVFNSIFSTNYIMLDELPAQLYEMFPFLEALPAAVWLEFAGAAALAVGYLAIRAVRNPSRSNSIRGALPHRRG